MSDELECDLLGGRTIAEELPSQDDKDALATEKEWRSFSSTPDAPETTGSGSVSVEPEEEVASLDDIFSEDDLI